MSKKSAEPIWVDIKQSYYILAFIISVHGLALLNSLFFALAYPVKMLLIALICCSFYFHFKRYRQGFYQISIKYTPEFAWELVNKKSINSIRILNSSVITSLLIILHVESKGKRRSLLICKDALSAEKYRQLLVTLKLTAVDKLNSID